MTEENKFKPIDTINLYDDGIGKVTLFPQPENYVYLKHSNHSIYQIVHLLHQQ